MRVHALIMLAALATAIGTSSVRTQTAPLQEAKAQTGAVLARGKYIVDHVSLCGDCHTPRNEKGEPRQSQYLQGADMGVEPTAPVPNFVRISPDITARGLAGWSLADLTRLLETGRKPNKELLRPPMPTYKMAHADAVAVARYLKSVGANTK